MEPVALLVLTVGVVLTVLGATLAWAGFTGRAFIQPGASIGTGLLVGLTLLTWVAVVPAPA